MKLAAARIREAPVYENSKVLPSRQSGSRFDHADWAQAVHNVERLMTKRRAELAQERIANPTTANLTAMKYFGSAIAELFECSSCYVASMPHGAGSELEEARIGHATIDPSCATAVARFALRGTGLDRALLKAVNARTMLVRKLIGPEPGAKSHSVIGRFASGDGATVVFVAGWRSAPLLRSEIPCLARAVYVMWQTARAQAPRRYADSQTWLEELVFPAILVDENLHIYEVNSSARTLLTKAELLKVDCGRLAGLSGSVTEALKEALRETLMARGGHGRPTTTVPLSTENQQFAFANIGSAPAHCDAGKGLVIVPQFDEVSGAKRIASAFGLNWAEERIVARILQRQCPRYIGADLRLTEATVRTYTKRIMLKLGINRQSEFFLLYHLTLSPFGAGRRDKTVGRSASDSRLNERTH
jgi:DNA-binding CsgD family transcriptional regulator